jgi:endoglucanase
MLDSHVDEIGLAVKHIDDKGFIYFQVIGGVDPAMVRGKRVNIHTAKGIVRGIIGAPAIHLREKDKEPKVPKIHESYIDIGAGSAAQARKRVSVGDPITFVDDFELLDANVAVARAFDNRAGAWAVIEALRIASQGRPKCAVFACSSVQEEVGVRGAEMNVFNIKPQAALVTDVTHATDVPGVDAKQHGEVKIGKGPTVSIGRENHPALVDRIRNVAKRKKIPVQIEAFSLTGGTDAWAIYTKQGGIPSAVISIPNRYMHTTVEVLDLRDLQRAAELMAAVCLDLKKGERFVVKV